MNPFDKAEVERIRKTIELNKGMEDFFEKKRKDWDDMVIALFERSKIDLDNPTSLVEIAELESLSLSYRQRITDEINNFMNRRSSEYAKNKELKQHKFIYYATGYSIKTNKGEKDILIDGHLAHNERTTELIEGHIEYLRATYENLKSLNYSVKNTIELVKYLKSI